MKNKTNENKPTFHACRELAPDFEIKRAMFVDCITHMMIATWTWRGDTYELQTVVRCDLVDAEYHARMHLVEACFPELQGQKRLG